MVSFSKTVLKMANKTKVDDRVYKIGDINVLSIDHMNLLIRGIRTLGRYTAKSAKLHYLFQTPA